jgi:hypothetical protein
MVPALVLSVVGLVREARKGYAVAGLVLATSPLWSALLYSLGCVS